MCARAASGRRGDENATSDTTAGRRHERPWTCGGSAAANTGLRSPLLPRQNPLSRFARETHDGCGADAGCIPERRVDGPPRARPGGVGCATSRPKPPPGLIDHCGERRHAQQTAQTAQTGRAAVALDVLAVGHAVRPTASSESDEMPGVRCRAKQSAGFAQPSSAPLPVRCAHRRPDATDSPERDVQSTSRAPERRRWKGPNGARTRAPYHLIGWSRACSAYRSGEGQKTSPVEPVLRMPAHPT